MNLYKKCTVKAYSSLVNDTTLASDNPLRFKNSKERKNCRFRKKYHHDI